MNSESHTGLTKDFTTMSENGAGTNFGEDIELGRQFGSYGEKASRFGKMADDINENK